MTESASLSNERLIEERLRAFTRRNHSLRLYASRIAAMAGFNPYACLPELFMNLVYQGGQELFQHDARLLGIQICSDEEVLLKLAAKASESTTEALKSALDVKKGKRVLDTVHVADEVKQKVLKEAKNSKKLNLEEMKVLQEGVRSSVDTGYGRHHEEEALNLYEKQCGWEVRDRNAAVMAWPFVKAEDVDAQVQTEQPTVVPMTKPVAAWKKSESSSEERKHSDDALVTEVKSEVANVERSSAGELDSVLKQPKGIELVAEITQVTPKDNESGPSCDGDAAEVDVAQEIKLNLATCVDGAEETASQTQPSCELEEVTKKEGSRAQCVDAADTNDSQCQDPPNSIDGAESMQRPFFTIMGSVDGIRDELWCPPASEQDDPSMLDEDWSLRQIIVECKHRMKKTINPPPLYDQIQTTAYCLMYDVDEADIVQVIRKAESPRKKQKVANDMAKSNDTLKVVDKSSTETDGDSQVVDAKIRSDEGKTKTEECSDVIGGDLATGRNEPVEKGSELTGEAEGKVTEEMSADIQDMDAKGNSEGGSSSDSREKIEAHNDAEGDDSVSARNKPAGAASNLRGDHNSGKPCSREEEDSNKPVGNPTQEATLPATVEINVKRVTLDDPVMQHRRNWHAVVLPRVRSFVEAVYRNRANEEKRYRLISGMSDPSGNGEAWKVLFEECPWLKDCDTAFGRDY